MVGVFSVEFWKMQNVRWFKGGRAVARYYYTNKSFKNIFKKLQKSPKTVNNLYA